MIDPERRELLSVLTELSEVRPEYRLRQIVANLVMLARGDAERAIWDLEDEELLEAARKLLADVESRRQPSARRSPRMGLPPDGSRGRPIPSPSSRGGPSGET